MRKKWIEISIKESGNDRYKLEIISQSHIDYNFGNKGSNFLSSTGFELCSASCPQDTSNRLYVRGTNRNLNDRQLNITKIYKDRVIQAVNEYNIYYGSPEKCYGYYYLPKELFEL
jgi:hypothetical protein